MVMIVQALLLALPALAAENPVVVGPARFTVVAAECVRLEYQAQGRFVDDPSLFAMERGARDDDFRLTRSSAGIVIDTGRIRLTYVPDGKPFSAANLTAHICADGVCSDWQAGRFSAARDLGGTRNLDEVKGPATTEPGLLSREGWRVYDDSRGILYKDGWAALRPKDSGLDWYLFGYGADYKAALKALAKIGGAVPLPRRYTLGSWYSRWWPHTAADYERIVGEYRAHGFPLDVLVMDMDWHLPNDWTGYTWNRKLFPDPAGYLKWVHEQGLFATLNEHPDHGVQPFEAAYVPFMKALGADPASGKTLPFDAGDRRYLEAESKYVRDPLEKQGVDFWWLDYWNDDEQGRPLNDLAWLNEYYYRHSERGGLRGQCFARWQQWSDHRHPMLFSGDTFIGWPTLAYEVAFTAQSGDVGAFFWSHDIGGYQGVLTPELFARWVQFGALSAALRLHSTKDPALDKRPWTWGLDAEESMRRAYALRDELFPYIYSSAWESHDQSIPLVRALYIDYPLDGEAYDNPQEYFFGDDFAAAPITSPGFGDRKLASQKYWLPGGLWYDWYSGDRIQGPVKGKAWATLDEIPLFVRGGQPIPMEPFTERMATTPLSTLIVRAYPGEEGRLGTFDLYEDDGESLGYLEGRRALTTLDYLKKGAVVTVVVDSTRGSFSGQLGRRAVVFELPRERVTRAELDGKPAAIEYDAKTGVSRISAPAKSIRAARTLKAWVR